MPAERRELTSEQIEKKALGYKKAISKVEAEDQALFAGKPTSKRLDLSLATDTNDTYARFLRLTDTRDTIAKIWPGKKEHILKEILPSLERQGRLAVIDRMVQSGTISVKFAEDVKKRLLVQTASPVSSPAAAEIKVPESKEDVDEEAVTPKGRIAAAPAQQQVGQREVSTEKQKLHVLEIDREARTVTYEGKAIRLSKPVLWAVFRLLARNAGHVVMSREIVKVARAVKYKGQRPTKDLIESLRLRFDGDGAKQHLITNVNRRYTLNARVSYSEPRDQRGPAVLKEAVEITMPDGLILSTRGRERAKYLESLIKATELKISDHEMVMLLYGKDDRITQKRLSALRNDVNEFFSGAKSDWEAVHAGVKGKERGQQLRKKGTEETQRGEIKPAAETPVVIKGASEVAEAFFGHLFGPAKHPSLDEIDQAYRKGLLTAKERSAYVERFQPLMQVSADFGTVIYEGRTITLEEPPLREVFRLLAATPNTPVSSLDIRDLAKAAGHTAKQPSLASIGSLRRLFQDNLKQPALFVAQGVGYSLAARVEIAKEEATGESAQAGAAEVVGEPRFRKLTEEEIAQRQSRKKRETKEAKKEKKELVPMGTESVVLFGRTLDKITALRKTIIEGLQPATEETPISSVDLRDYVYGDSIKAGKTTAEDAQASLSTRLKKIQAEDLNRIKVELVNKTPKNEGLKGKPAMYYLKPLPQAVVETPATEETGAFPATGSLTGFQGSEANTNKEIT